MQYLLLEKEDKSKLSNLSYSKLKPQDYLIKNTLSVSDKKFLFKLRTRMLNIGDNMGRKDDLCPLCYTEKDTQNHLLECPIINLHIDYSENTELKQVNYEDIFSNNIEKITDACTLMRKIFRMREVLLSQNK